ncbi:MAG: ribosome assembly RNA-binding protein YhbY [Turicibacter sp.]|nr:ribosome assembly RNA-binding protein YhbY [Turicibacter sp.]
MLTGKQKNYLRGIAHKLQPIIQIGKGGVNDMLLKTIEDALEARELIKVSVLQNCMEAPKILAPAIAEAVGGEVVQVIGRTLVFYKESNNKKEIVLPK